MTGVATRPNDSTAVRFVCSFGCLVSCGQKALPSSLAAADGASKQRTLRTAPTVRTKPSEARRELERESSSANYGFILSGRPMYRCELIHPGPSDVKNVFLNNVMASCPRPTVPIGPKQSCIGHFGY